MPDFPIDPELRIRASPPLILRRTSFEAARDEWSAMEAVVQLELLLEAGGLLIEQGTAYDSRSGQGRSRAA